MTAHAALPADRHRAGFTEEQEYLQSGGKDGHIRLVLKMVQTETASDVTATRQANNGCRPQIRHF